MPLSVCPFLMFQGDAEAAIKLYTGVIRDSRIVRLEKYAPGEAGPVGKVKRANIVLAGQPVMAIDSPVKHAFAFTPSSSMFVECADEGEIISLSKQLGEDGTVLMALDNYGFSKRFAWFADRFGVTWQLNLQS